MLSVKQKKIKSNTGTFTLDSGIIKSDVSISRLILNNGTMNINGLNADKNILNAYGQILCYNEDVYMNDEHIASASLSDGKYHHSMFVLNDETDLNIYGVTIQNAYRGNDTLYNIDYKDNEDKPQTKYGYQIYEDYAVTHGNGSVIFQSNPDSNIYLQDVKVVHNRSYGLGGAIYAVKGFTINALNGDVLFDDNYQNETNTDNAFTDYDKLAPSRDAVANDIYINNTSDITMNLNAANGKTLQLKDGILWANNNYALNININKDYGNTTGKVLLGGDFGNNTDYKYNLDVYGGFGFVDGTARAMNINTLTLYDDVHYYVDVDIKSALAGKSDITDTIFARNLNFNTFKLVMDSTSFNNIGRFNTTSSPTYCAVTLRILDVDVPASKYIELRDAQGESVDTISWLEGRTTYYARLGINGTIIYGTSIDDRTSLLYQAVSNPKANTFKMTSNYMLYGLQGTDADGNIVDIPEFLTLQNSKLTIDGRGYYIATNNNGYLSLTGETLNGFVVPEPQPKKSISLTIKNVSDIRGFNGALVNRGGKISVSGTNFNKNESNTYGSVARNEKGTLSISGSSKTHSMIRNNTSNEMAGAVYNAGTFTAKYVDFGAAGTSRETFSNVSEIGGALYNAGELAKATLTSTKFIENIASLYGGGVYSNNTLSISSSQFERNTAMSGGAVYFDTLADLTVVPKFTISKSTFEGNTASDKAGAVYTETYITDSSSTFKNNSADVDGGAIYVNTPADSANKLTNKFTSTKFYGNTATEKGGAIYINTKDYSGIGDNTRTKATFSKVVFGSTDVSNKGNTAKDGGAIYNTNANISLSAVNFIGNTANDKGGALYNESDGIVAITKGSFGTSDKTGSVTNGNNAVYGGAIYNAGAITSKSTTFAGNKAVHGGAIYTKASDNENIESNITLTSVTMKFNGVTSKSGIDESPVGGAIYNAAYMNIASSTFTSNFAKDGKGGAIYNSKDSVGLDLKKVTFTGNYAQYGNAIYNDGKIGTISATFKSNITTTPNSAGGAIYNNASIEAIDGSTFTLNQSAMGGAIYNAEEATIAKINKVTIGNSAKNANTASYGGAIYNAGTISEITASKLSRNVANISGGAIYNTGLISSIVGTAMSYETSSSDGGAIYNTGRIEYIDRTSALSSNKTTGGNGGAIYNNGFQTEEAYMQLSGMTLSSNTAVNGNGGAIYNGEYGEIEFLAALVGTKPYYTTFKSNSAGYNGGAIYNAGHMTFDSVTFTSNKSTSGNGGAIYNSGVLDITQTSTFTSNTAYDGGAIYNAFGGKLTLDNVTFGNAKNNKNANKATHNGGAIYNAGELKLSNSVLSRNSSENHGGLIFAQAGSETILATQTISYNTAKGDGGAVYTLGTLYLNKNADDEALSSAKDLIFSNNTASRGGAIYAGESAVLDIILTEFSSNKATNGNGGAIALISGPSAVGGNIITDSKFSNNTAMLGKGYSTAEDTSKGGAIYNEDELTIEYTEFENNFAGYGGNIYNLGVLTLGEGVVFRFAPAKKAKYTYSLQGGAIYNAGTLNQIGDITFSGHKVNGDGGAVYNNSEGTIVFDKNSYVTFENNTATGNGGALFNGNIVTMDSAAFNNNSAINGGAIYNDGILNINNSVQFNGNSATKNGGIIFNGGELYVHGDRSNKIELSNSSAQNGGAIASGYSLYTTSSRTKLVVANAIFRANTAKVSDKDTGSKGGAIYNGGNAQPRFTTITNAEFYDNQSIGTGKSNSTGGGGAIWNDAGAAIQEDNGTAGLTDSIFDGNSTIIDGGAIGNQGTIIMSNNVFNNNSATKFGGAIYNNGSYTSSNDRFTANHAGTGGAIYNGLNGTYQSSDNEYLDNFANGTDVGNGNGGAIYNSGEFISQNDLYENNRSNINGGAIYAAANSKTVIDNGTFTDNRSVADGGAIYVSAYANTTVKDNSTFTGNSAVRGGAVYVGNYATFTMIDSSMTGNSASNDYSGGAIFADANSTVNIIAKECNVDISNNGTYDIALSYGSVLNLDAYEGRKITIGGIKVIKNDTSVGQKDPTINYAGNVVVTRFSVGEKNEEFKNGAAGIVHKIEGNGFVEIQDEAIFNNASMVLADNSTMSLSNGRIGRMSLRSLSINDGDTANVSIDMDLKGGIADSIYAENKEGNGTLSVNKITLTSNSKTPVDIPVADGDSAIGTIGTTTAESAEATYKIKTFRDDNGVLRTIAYGQKAKNSTLAAPIAAQIGGYLTQINTYDQAFANLDMEMLKTSSERKAEEMMNKYASAVTSPSMPATYSEKDGINYNSKGLWNRAYATFENIPFHNGPKVNNVGYGNFFGGDMGKKELRNGWQRQFSAYIGYNGSTQDYTRQSIDQNGGTIGVMETWYKGNFFTSLTANVGGNNAEANTDLGKERMAMIMAGIASKTGYNFEFKNGKFIVQPSILLSYSFIHTFDHNNGVGSRVKSNPISALQVAPGIKFIANLKNGWQPYLGVNMRWNIIDQASFSIPDVTLPTLSVRPYVEYGVGVQKRWGERFTGYGQAMIRNGGRNGVMLSIGFRWAIGK